MPGPVVADGAQNLSKKSSGDARRRLPATMGGFSVNFCRNPRCERFGILPDPFDGRGRSGEDNRGKISGSGEERSYFCPSCGVASSVKSNRAIAEEYARIRRERRRTNGKHCQNSACANHGLAVSLSPSSYSRFGTTAKGDPRYQCKACRKTFSIGKPTRRHKQTDDTGAILKSLVNKMPLTRICEVHDVSHRQIYEKIDFLYRQAVAFSTAREARLDECLAGRSVWLAADIQVILVNWPVKRRRGTIPLLHMATTHKFLQFAVAATVDLDESTRPEALEEVIEQCGDFALPRSMRRHARLWAQSEYQDSLLRSQSGLFSKDDLAIAGKLRLPGSGCRVRGDAFKFAHMMMVKKLVGERFKRLHDCLDDEAGLAAAVCALNVGLIRSGQVNVAEISFAKGLTNDGRLQAAAEGRQALDAILTAGAAEIAAMQAEFRI